MTDAKRTIDGSTKPVLILGADHFGVELGEKDGAPLIKEKIKADGITDAQWNEFLTLKETVEHEAEVVDPAEDGKQQVVVTSAPQQEAPQTLLIKMKRKNPSMSIRGYQFTTRHPYQVVPVKDAEFIVQSYKGFSVALPSEIEEFYK